MVKTPTRFSHIVKTALVKVFFCHHTVCVCQRATRLWSVRCSGECFEKWTRDLALAYPQHFRQYMSINSVVLGDKRCSFAPLKSCTQICHCDTVGTHYGDAGHEWAVSSLMTPSGRAASNCVCCSAARQRLNTGKPSDRICSAPE